MRVGPGGGIVQKTTVGCSFWGELGGQMNEDYERNVYAAVNFDDVWDGECLMCARGELPGPNVSGVTSFLGLKLSSTARLSRLLLEHGP